MGMITNLNIMVAMRDGVRLATDVFRPPQGGRRPVLLTRVPYSKDAPFPGMPNKRMFLELSFDVARVVADGYVVVIQDTRGRYASEGEFTPIADETIDGVDTIAWAAAQPWSSGQVGMFGESYQGLSQWLAAQEQPEALRAIAPMHAPFVHSTMYTYYGGAFQMATGLGWAVTQGATGEMQRRVAQGRASQTALDALVAAEQDLGAVFERLPLIDQPLLEGVATYFFEWLADPERQAEQHAEAQRTLYPGITVPALIIGGWYDYFLPATLAHYQGIKQHGSNALARHPRLVVGPWTHVDFPGLFAERDFGPSASTRAIDLTAIHLRWFDRWLKDIDNGVERDKPVRIFVMGIDQWRDEDDWPLPDTQHRSYYLHSGGHANTRDGDGLLSIEVPESVPADIYTYDPRDPVPSVGGAIMLDVSPTECNTGPMDQLKAEKRDDVLCFTTPPLDGPVEVIGPVELVLHVTSSAPDTAVTAKLVDVYPDGRAEILCDGILRARYRKSLTAPALMEPGQVCELRIDVGSVANVFRAGQRIRLEVSSSNFPRFDPNSNTGGRIAYERAEEMVPAINRIFHDDARPSRLILPIIERGPKP